METETAIQITLDEQRVLVNQKIIQSLAVANPSLFKRVWLAANGYQISEKTSADHVMGIWATLNLIPDNAISNAKNKRLQQIEGNYKNSAL